MQTRLGYSERSDLEVSSKSVPYGGDGLTGVTGWNQIYPGWCYHTRNLILVQQKLLATPRLHAVG